MDTSSIYPFKTQPFIHQLTCWLRNKDADVFAYLAEMGTGKSKMLIDTLAVMYDLGRVNALALIAPKSVYRNWADSQLPAHMPDHIRYKVGIWAAEGRKADLDSLELVTRAGDMALHVLLMNVEALGRDLENNRAYAFLERFLRMHKTLLAVDESTTIKNPKATRTKALIKLRKLAPVRRILSGQPAVNGPLDMYSQCEFLDPALLGYSSYYSYKAHFAKLVPMRVITGVDEHGKPKARKFDKVAGYQNLDELQRKVSKFSFIVKKVDCLDLPAKLPPVMRNVELGAKQAKAYKDMQSMAIVELEQALDGISKPEHFSTANLVITQMLRLHQILCGFIVNDVKQPVVFDEVNPRMEDLMECLDEVSGKVVIWTTYKLTVRQIVARLAKEYGPESMLHYYGDTSDAERKEVHRHFDPNHPRKVKDSPVRFVVSNKTGAYGNTWTEAHTAIYHSYLPDLDMHDQSQDRIHRIGQHWPCSYLYQRVPGTVEDKYLLSLRTKQQLSALITPSNCKEFLT